MTRLLAAALMVAVVATAILFATSRAGQSDEQPPKRENGVLECERTVLAIYTLPRKGAEGSQHIFFSTPEEAAQSAYQRYKDVGRVDGGVVGNLRRVGSSMVFYVTGGETDYGRGVLQLNIEDQGGEYALAGWAACEDALPNDGFES